VGGVREVCRAFVIKPAWCGTHGALTTGVQAGWTINSRRDITKVVRYVILAAHLNSFGGPQDFSKQAMNGTQRLPFINRHVEFDLVVKSLTKKLAVCHHMTAKRSDCVPTTLGG